MAILVQRNSGHGQGVWAVKIHTAWGGRKLKSKCLLTGSHQPGETARTLQPAEDVASNNARNMGIPEGEELGQEVKSS